MIDVDEGPNAPICVKLATFSLRTDHRNLVIPAVNLTKDERLPILA
jgi:hypothetical protein